MRQYSSDSLGSDGVFIEDSPYQGMLKPMDSRKGSLGVELAFLVRLLKRNEVCVCRMLMMMMMVVMVVMGMMVMGFELATPLKMS